MSVDTASITRKPRSTTVAGAVSWVTFREIVGDKVLYNIILCAGLLFCVSFLASRLSFVRPDRILLDFGLTAVRLSCAMIATLCGSAMLGREFERRTIQVALSRPISRLQFVIGKFLGLAGVLWINWLVLSLCFSLMVWGISGELSLIFNSTYLWALVMAFLESLVVGGIAVMFSTFSTTSLSVIVTIGLYLIGHNISQVLLAAARIRTGWLSSLVRHASAFLPNLEHFELGTQVAYGLPVTATFCLGACAYALLSVTVFMLLSGLLIRGRES